MPSTTPVAVIAVKNVGRSPQIVDGCGAMSPGDSGEAVDNQHTRALIDAGHLLAIDEPEPDASSARKRATTTAKGE